MKDYMKIKLQILAVACIVLTFATAFFAISLWKKNTVAKVIDGDSFETADGRRVRMLGLDAPELANCMGNEAKNYLEGIIEGRHIRLKNTVKDSYGRILANVIVEDWNAWKGYIGWWVKKKLGQKAGRPDPDPFVNRDVVAKGLARFESVKSPYFDILKFSQEEARKEKLGIWSENCRNIKAPSRDCLIKGNIRDRKKTYHLPGCPNYEDTVVDTAFGDQWFCSEEDAQGAGFEKAGGCGGNSSKN